MTKPHWVSQNWPDLLSVIGAGMASGRMLEELDTSAFDITRAGIFRRPARRPPRGYRPDRHKPLAERDPVRFWQGVSLLLVGVIVALLVLR